MSLSARTRLFGGSLASTAQNANSEWSARRGLVLELRSSDGVFGQGEASPLSHYSPDALAECEQALKALDPSRLQLLPEPASAVSRLRDAVAQLPPDLPAARHALETALLDLWSRSLAVPAWALLRDIAGVRDSVRPVALTTLLPALSDRRALGAGIETALARGVAAFKLKLGRDFETELEAARLVRKQIGGAVLRLDVNQAWSVEQARERLARLAELEPEFAEEPVATRDLARLGRSPVPLALDESLRAPEVSFESAVTAGVRVLVLKPMALGGIVRCLELAALSRKHDLHVVVSHLLDGPVALAAAATLALAVQTPERAVGLDAHPGLVAWPKLTIPALAKAAIVPWSEPGLGLPPLLESP